MRRFGGLLAAALVLGAPALARAQETATPVGPAELRDFALPGTAPPPVREEPAPAPAPTPPPAAETPPPAPRQTPREEPAPRPAPRATAPAAAPRERVQEQAPPPVAATPSGRAPEPLPQPSLEREIAPAPAPAPVQAPPASAPAAQETGGSASWLWGLLAVLLGLGGLAVLGRIWRVNRGAKPADEEPYELTLDQAAIARAAADGAPVPKPAAASPPAAEPAAIGAPAPAPAVDPLRARIEFVFKPAKAESTEAGASVHYDLIVKNLGNEPARNIRIEARMFNAGAEQEKEIGTFFGHPLLHPLAVRPFDIPARSQAKLSRVVSMDRSQVRAITIQGRPLFIPMVAFNIVYERGEGEIGQTSRCYVVGRESETPTEKMGAFRLDVGPRIYRSIGQRQTKLARIA